MRAVMTYHSAGGGDYHLCGWAPCRRHLPCPDAHRNLSPCLCKFPSLALVEDEGRELEPHETGTSELFFCSQTCLQRWMESYFVCESDSEDEEDLGAPDS